jgi:hypothetical protein
VYKDNIESFLEKGRGWFPKKLPKSIVDKIEVVKHGSMQKKPYP